MLMVIFGAGASYDSYSSLLPGSIPRHSLWQRPPLAKELFLPLREYREIARRYDRFVPLIPHLEEHENIEAALEVYRLEAEVDRERRSQLWAIQYYIRNLITSCEQHWKDFTLGVSNYRTLLDQVRASRVCFVTFNYDTLMESALVGLGFPTTTTVEYIDRGYDLINLHGSTNWSYWVPAIKVAVQHKNKQPTDTEVILAAPVVGDDAIIGLDGNRPPQAERELYLHLPALAIPTATKHNFVCPPSHLSRLSQHIQEVTKIAVIGWRAAERHFLDMLVNGLERPVRVIAACGDVASAEETLTRMRTAGIQGDFRAAPGGFTDFVRNHRITSFLAG